MTSHSFPPKHIAIMGSGAWGTALALSCLKTEHKVTLIARRSEQAHEMNNLRENKAYLPGISLPNSLKISSDVEILKECDLLLLVTPAQQTRNTLTNLKPFLTHKPPIVLCAKGIEIPLAQNALPQFLGEVANEVLGASYPIAVLSGPNFASEVALGLPAATTIAAATLELAIEISNILRHNHFRCYATDDIIGVQIGGALKNIYAIASGILRGLNLGTNASIALITRALAEMNRLGLTLGAQQKTFTGLSTVGDLFMTCSFEQSRNMSFGKELAQGETVSTLLNARRTVTEGVHTTKALYPLINHLKVRMPLASAMYDILVNNAPIKDVVNSILSGQSLCEFDN